MSMAEYFEKTEGVGKWLYLSKTGEETDADVIEFLGKRKHSRGDSGSENRYLVYFAVEKERPLVGDWDE
jgi:hypothetical protein